MGRIAFGYEPIALSQPGNPSQCPAIDSAHVPSSSVSHRVATRQVGVYARNRPIGIERLTRAVFCLTKVSDETNENHS